MAMAWRCDWDRVLVTGPADNGHADNLVTEGGA
jgi:hypothetical protein